ncbi:MAG: ISAs1 family transposase, partial [Actinobacteria bacterium]|nr:ISAs1 family transposase [Actinomycetota bacterium]
GTSPRRIAMTAGHDLSIARYFADLPDPRIDRTEKHALLDILAIALCATIAGADSREGVQRFGKARRAWLGRSLALPNGIPSHDTFDRVFARIDPRAFTRRVADWMAAACEATGLRHVASDGKSARSAPRGTFCGCLHLVSAWAAESRLILGQEAVADGSHEIAAIPDLLRVLDLKGALVTPDAAGCQTAIAGQIRAGGGHYLLAVKGDQPTLHEAVTGVFDRACEADFAGYEHDGHEQVEDGHGRHEERYTTVIDDPEGLPAAWPDVAAAVLVGRERSVKGVNASTAHYYITSLRGTAAELGRLVRRHWSVENELHWAVDVAFGEDGNRTAAGHAGANLGLIRRVAASLLKQDPSRGASRPSGSTQHGTATIWSRYYEDSCSSRFSGSAAVATDGRRDEKVREPLVVIPVPVEPLRRLRSPGDFRTVSGPEGAKLLIKAQPLNPLRQTSLVTPLAGCTTGGSRAAARGSPPGCSSGGSRDGRMPRRSPPASHRGPRPSPARPPCPRGPRPTPAGDEAAGRRSGPPGHDTPPRPVGSGR